MWNTAAAAAAEWGYEYVWRALCNLAFVKLAGPYSPMQHKSFINKTNKYKWI